MPRLRNSRGIRAPLVAPCAVAALVASGCGGRQSALDPAGPQASEIASLWWLMLGVGGVIVALVVALLAVALVGRRGANGSRPPGPFDGQAFVVAGGVLLPLVVLPVLMALTIRGVQRLDASDDRGMHVEVIAHDWWWEFHYPDAGAVTANELHLPVGEPIHITGTSADVIHSFWAPSLHGKIDLIPGRSNTLVLQADRVGTYRGQCAEFCGIQHARMAFHVVVEERPAFEAWLQAQALPAVTPADSLASAGRDVFLEHACRSCHAIRGTPADGAVGPDLTHVAGRAWLAGGTIENNRSNLATWIVSPQALKPGANMPPTPLSSADLVALLAFLGTLR